MEIDESIFADCDYYLRGVEWVGRRVVKNILLQFSKDFIQEVIVIFS